MRNLYARKNRFEDQGVSILIIAVSMVFVLGIAGLGIDLASLYVGRNQAQRAADAGALAAAQYLVGGSCTASSGTISANCQAKAKNQAVAVTNANLIAGITPNITTADVTFIETSATDPQVQVIAGRDTAHSNPMPTFFVKIFGINSANVSAKAVAEAYDASGGTAPVGVSCVKPWLMPNCDWNHLQSVVGGPVNTACYDSTTNKQYAQYIDAASQTLVAESAVKGQMVQIKSSDPSQASGPGQFYPVFLPIGSVASACPSCANGGGGSGPSSGSLYRQNIECCNQTQISCGDVTIQPITGNMVGPTAQGVDCLIHQQGSSGQDTIDPATFEMTAGSANPYNLSGVISTSDSMVTVPLYNGTPLCPGNSCPNQVHTIVQGFLQLFIKGESSGNVSAYVMNVVLCPAAGGGGSNSGPGTIASGGSPIPIRLIHQ